MINLKSQLFEEQVPAQLMGLFRIFYGLITLAVAATCWRFIEFNFFESFRMDINQAYLLSGTWIVLLCLLTLGYCVRITCVFSMVVANFLFDTSIGADLVQIGAFWLLLSDSHKSLSLSQSKIVQTLPAWPIFGLILNIIPPRTDSFCKKRSAIFENMTFFNVPKKKPQFSRDTTL